MNLSDFDSALSQINQTASENSAWSAEQAQIQRDWQVEQNAKAMEYNAQEAAKNRSWQEYMSNTAHQREVADLQAAGLNPVLSAMNGNGASVTSGATASGVSSQGAKGERDTSANSALVSILGSMLNAQTQLEAANINARTQEAVADKYTAMEKVVSQIAANASMFNTKYTVDNPNSAAGLIRSFWTGTAGYDNLNEMGKAVGLALDTFAEQASPWLAKQITNAKDVALSVIHQNDKSYLAKRQQGSREASHADNAKKASQKRTNAQLNRIGNH